METNAESIREFLKKKAEQHWAQFEQPYLLSAAAPEMKSTGIDYKEILNEESLKAFVKRTSDADGYRLVEHPLQKAKVGIVPSSSCFEFAVDASAARRVQTTRDNEGASLFAFLRALSTLPEEDISSVTIPTRVLVKLLRKK